MYPLSLFNLLGSPVGTDILHTASPSMKDLLSQLLSTGNIQPSIPSEIVSAAESLLTQCHTSSGRPISDNFCQQKVMKAWPVSTKLCLRVSFLRNLSCDSSHQESFNKGAVIIWNFGTESLLTCDKDIPQVVKTFFSGELFDTRWKGIHYLVRYMRHLKNIS